MSQCRGGIRKHVNDYARRDDTLAGERGVRQLMILGDRLREAVKRAVADKAEPRAHFLREGVVGSTGKWGGPKTIALALATPDRVGAVVATTFLLIRNGRAKHISRLRCASRGFDP